MSSSRLHASMKRHLPAAALIALLAPASASAGVYVGIAAGKSPAVGGDAAATFSDDGDAGRLVLGGRLTYVAVEAEASRAVLAKTATGTPWYASTLAASLKLFFPLGDHLEVFGRGGLSRSGLGPDPGLGRDADTTYVGNGIIVGSGLQYRLSGKLAKFALWGEYARQQLDLHKRDDSAQELHGSLDTVTVGVSVGL